MSELIDVNEVAGCTCLRDRTSWLCPQLVSRSSLASGQA
jgi:hypothetical protein